MIKKFGGDLGFIIGVGENIDDVNKKVAKKKYKKFDKLIYKSKSDKNIYEQFFKFKSSVEGSVKRCMTCRSINP